MKTFQWVGLLVILLGGHWGCGAGEDNSKSTIVTSVDESKPVNEVTPAETAELCEATNDYFKRSLPAAEICKIDGLQAYGDALESGADPEDACVEASADCIRAGAPDFGITCEESEALPPTCDATVGEMKLCLQAIIDKQAELWYRAKFPACDGVVEFSMSEEARNINSAFDYEPAELPACKNLSAACVEVFSDTDDSDI